MLQSRAPFFGGAYSGQDFPVKRKQCIRKFKILRPNSHLVPEHGALVRFSRDTFKREHTVIPITITRIRVQSLCSEARSRYSTRAALNSTWVLWTQHYFVLVLTEAPASSKVHGNHFHEMAMEMGRALPQTRTRQHHTECEHSIVCSRAK